MIYSSSTNVEETYTLSQFISMKDNDEITYRNFSILQKSITDPTMIYSIDNVIYDYLEEMKLYRKLVTVSDQEKIKYKYKPKLLSYDIYGSTEAYFILLAMNGMCNIKEFDLLDNTFWALSPTDMVTFLNTISKAESEYITLNRSNLGILES